MKILRIILWVFAIFCTAFTATVGASELTKRSDNLPLDYKGIITMWQVDSFEGGTGSRKQFLLKAARGFERAHEGVLVMVSNYTEEGVKENLEKGIVPDLISYGAGTEIGEVNSLEIKTSFKGGKVGEKTLAVAWCRGGYVLIENPNAKEKKGEEGMLLVSQGKYTQPLIALCAEEITAEKIVVKEPMDAYVKFVSGTVKKFLATQRDVVRLKNRGFEAQITPLEKFNDLFQYVSVTSKDEVKKRYAEKFIEYLISEKVQNALGEIAMFSVEMQAKLEDEKLIQMQSANNFITISAFTPRETLLLLHGEGMDALRGNESAQNKIKNMFILP